MSGKRTYTEGVKASLHVMCGGGCYRPGCGEPAIRFVDGEPEINLEFAHIHALEDDGPRAVPGMPIPERNSLSNLIWLCSPCHKRVDADVVRYPAGLLKKWKRARESKPLGSLAGLRDLDLAGMEALLRRAMTEVRHDMAAFTETFPDLARLLRETIERLPSLDPESLHLLDSAATRLSLPDHAPLMHRAAVRLDLPDYAPLIHSAAAKLNLPDYAQMLFDAARKLDLPDQVPRLYSATSSLREAIDSLSSTAEAVSAAVSHAEAAADHAANLAVSAPAGIRYVRRVSPKAAGIALLGWVIAVLLIYLHIKGHF